MDPSSVATILVCGMSRSGTTLVATMLDSHPRIAMGYELLPAGIERPRSASHCLEAVLADLGEGAGAKAVEAELADRGEVPLGRFVRTADRAGVGPARLVERLRASNLPERTDDLAGRIALSLAVVEDKRRETGASMQGFKCNVPSVEVVAASVPNPRAVFVLRDPRDVMASHIANGFDRDVEHVCRAWVGYLARFEAFMERHPERALLVRYEDLVSEPDRELGRVASMLGIEDASPMLRFHDSEATVHRAGHRNADALRQEVHRGRIGRWRSTLSRARVAEIDERCGPAPERHGYRRGPTEEPVATPRAARMRHGLRVKRASKFFRDEYARLILPFAEGRTNLTWHEAATGAPSATDEVLILRHDVDHDLDTALEMARWEQEHDLRATYCILHTAWYYGEFRDGRMSRYREMLEGCRALESMGHEINLHNNFPVLALQHGLDPVELMADELTFLRWHGLTVTGSSTHGDRLCRELEFRNYELFSECVYPARGGPRVVTHEGRSIRLGDVSMRELDLEYEAYDLPRDFYVTDSGGNLRVREDTRGRAGRRRRDLDPPPPYPRIVGILTHPIWWDFSRDAPEGRDFTELPREIEGTV